MEQYISKSALVAEIKGRRESNAKERYFGRLVEDNYFLDFLDTLEVKEVDLREEIDVYFQKNKNGYNGLLICKKEDFSVIAKHFFELGLKAQKGE